MSITHTLNENTSTLQVQTTGPLAKDDFERISKDIDPFIERTGELRGLILQVEHFPGWDSLSSLIRHLRFVREHHRNVRKVAFVTDSPVGEVMEHMASHFVSAEIRHFSSESLDEAKRWIETK